MYPELSRCGILSRVHVDLSQTVQVITVLSCSGNTCIGGMHHSKGFHNLIVLGMCLLLETSDHLMNGINKLPTQVSVNFIGLACPTYLAQSV